MKKYTLQLTMCTLLFGTSLVGSDFKMESIGFHLGSSFTQAKQNDIQETLTNLNQPDKSFRSYELYTVLKSLKDTKDIKPYISYTYGVNSELKNHSLLIGLNKYYANLYGGIVVGYGELRYRYNPIGSKENDTTATSFIVGIQGGWNYPLSNTLWLDLNLKALAHDYDVTLQPNNTIESQLTHKYTTSAMAGLAYRF